ncbi:unnamed protein product, partial [Didymodactylos carnosus]
MCYPIVLILSLAIRTVNGYIHLYNTDLTENGDYYDCLYTYSNIQVTSKHTNTNKGWSLLPYCFRLSDENEIEFEKKKCYGYPFTFLELKQKNVTSDDLYEWNSPIDVIDQYQKYIDNDLLDENSTTYCNCSSLFSFGSRCQYSFRYSSIENGFEHEIQEQFSLRYRLDDHQLMNNLTCYIELECKSILCLDWRQICNGIIDCQNGEDEENCLELEQNICNKETEYRCTNGMCIPRQFSFDLIFDCIDNSDANYNCAWLKYSCSDGQCINWIHSKDQTESCVSRRDFLFFRNLYAYEPSAAFSLLCWKYIMCYTNNSPYSYIPMNCWILCNKSNCLSLLYAHCTEPFIFPSSSTILPFVNTLYVFNRDNRTRPDNFPDFICHDLNLCNIYHSNDTINSYTCHKIEDFDLTVQAWPELIQAVQLLFSYTSCFVNKTVCTSNSQLFHCETNNECISKHRIRDGVRDCFDKADETYSDSCKLNLTEDGDYFKCLKTNRCLPRRRFLDGQIDCSYIDFFTMPSDRSDEPFRISCRTRDDFTCTLIRNINNVLPTYFLFQDICDDILWRGYLIDNETDETNCEQWPCNSRAKSCNGFWNCKDGRDELECLDAPLISSFLTYNLSKCNKNEHYCAQMLPSNNTVVFGCIPIQKAGDGVIDCLGATDERMGHCRSRFPLDSEFNGESGKVRYRCMNSSHCIRPQDLCDRRQTCSFEDDEAICPWLKETLCQREQTFSCKDSRLCININLMRCNGIIDCLPDGEDEWFCDITEKHVLREFSLVGINQYPGTHKSSRDLVKKKDLIITPKHRSVQGQYNNKDLWLCYRGIFLESKNLPSRIKCLCPPSYYGERCQYQSRRITLFLQVQTLNTFKSDSHLSKLVCYLFNTNNAVVSSEEIIHSPYNQSTHKHIISLSHAHTNVSSIRIDAYIVSRYSVDYQSSWYFPVKFSFLPVNRLAYHLILQQDNTFCSKAIADDVTCIHGICMKYVNYKKYYCLCNDGWSGERCNIMSPCDCGPNTTCVRLEKRKCICPVGRFGPTCHAVYDPCKAADCHNNGTCMPVDERSLKYVCICSANYYGDVCQYQNAHIKIRMDNNWHSSHIPAMVVHFLNIHHKAAFMVHQTSYLYKNFMFSTNNSLDLILDKQAFLTTFMYTQFFFTAKKYYGTYYLAAILKNSQINSLETVIMSSNYCPHVNELIQNQSIRELSPLKRVKYYYSICLSHKNISCYHDEIYQCFCDNKFQSDCLIFDHSTNNCTAEISYCQNDGLCKQTNRQGQWDFVCICDECYYGILCQFTTLQYSVSLDALIGSKIYLGKNIMKQPVVIKLSFIFAILMFTGSLITNTLSIMVFWQLNIRAVGCGIYLFVLSVVGQLGMFVFVVRFFYILLTKLATYENRLFAYYNCSIFEFLLTILSTIYDWLTVCIAIERAVTAVKGIEFNQRLSKTVAKYVISFVVLFNIIMSLHEPFHRQIIDDPISTSHTWCVMEFNRDRLKIYEIITNIIHLIVPFSINVISTIVFLLSLVRRKSRSLTNKDTYYILLKAQMRTHKPFVISPLLLVIIGLPRLIFTFIFACVKYEWQTYLYLVSYFISFLSLTGTLFVFILPSPLYKKELKTIL